MQLFQSFIIIIIKLNDIRAGISLFNDAEFFAAHDFFEDLWSESSPEDKFFYQGLVHISVGSFHLVSGNLNGALSQFSKGIKKLKPYNPAFQSIDIEKLLLEVEKLVALIQIEEKTTILGDLLSKLPKIEYII